MDFLACLMMCIGLVFFTLADSTVQPSFNLFGKLICLKLKGHWLKEQGAMYHMAQQSVFTFKNANKTKENLLKL